MLNENELIRFDWAIKNMLRNKANFDILEGFLSALLKEDIKVLKILESESNKEEEKQKFNRVDLMVEDGQGRKIIIEIQNQREADYIERLLWGASKAVVESVEAGNFYKDVAKVISISILYFNLGLGKDYVYYGKTEFKGMNTGEPLIVKEKAKVVEQAEKTVYKVKENTFPEYYLIKVNAFEDIVKEDIDEWIYLFKHNKIKDEFRSKNIKKAMEKLSILKMNKEDRKAYERYLVSVAIELDVMETAREEGLEEGIDIGIEKGMEKGMEKRNLEVAQNMLSLGVDTAIIEKTTGLTKAEIEKLNQASQD